jgi:triosephosphate isomerase
MQLKRRVTEVARRTFIAGNWKLHKGPQEAEVLANALKRLLVDQTGVDIAVAPPYISIPAVADRLKHTGILIAAQDVHAEAKGAYTSAISSEMLKEAGCAYTLVGHSERRSLFGDDDALINAKVHSAFRAGLLPILCCGETLAQREAGEALAVITGQLAAALSGLEPDQVVSTTIAYEPVWAIGTGVTASPAQAQDMHASIRAWLAANYPAFVPAQTRIQYGGSVKPANAKELLSQPDIDGALVGGASLDADSFLAIVRAGA